MIDFSSKLVITFKCTAIPIGTALPFELVFVNLPSMYYKANNISINQGLVVSMDLDIDTENPGDYISTFYSFKLGNHDHRPDSFSTSTPPCNQRTPHIGQDLVIYVTYRGTNRTPVRKNYDQATHKGGRPGTLKKNK